MKKNSYKFSLRVIWKTLHTLHHPTPAHTGNDMKERTKPLFRTLATVPTVPTLAASAADDTIPHPDNCVMVGSVGDVTNWIGRTVTPRLYTKIEKRVNALGWTVEATATDELLKITRITAR